MTGDVMLLLVGAVLILVAARAGGSRAIGIAPPGAALRLGAATAGLLCVVAAVILISGDGGRETPGPVNVAITNELGPQQLSEEIRVFIDGRHVGVLKVDTRSPKARMVVAVSKLGRHAYKLVARRRAQGRSLVEVSSKGDVVIDGDSPLTFYSDPSGRTYLGR